VKKTLTFYEYTTVCHKYDVNVEVPDDADLNEWLITEDEAIGLAEIYGNVLPKQISNEVEGLEVWDSEGQLLLQY
jgi:hypothetical protein|tara:strand:+ start:135 stop:359 length:225 start_codon:yes stop_codon:yes gene_type:complete